MPNPLTLEICARRESLPLALAAVDEFCRAARADRETAFALRLVVEEVCMNLIEHGYAGRSAGEIGLGFEQSEGELVVTIRDHGVPFDPAQAPQPDLISSAEARPIGGLGWHLIKNMIDEVDYRSDPQRGNELRLIRRKRVAPHTQGGEGGTVSEA